VLVLTPEIGLTPQLLERFRQRFGAGVAPFHSGLSERARAESWLAARDGRARIVIGTRSAVFVPLPELRLVVVDEEHDVSYKQQEGFRYSARDVAVVRAQRARVPVLLGSATPSLETLHNVQRHRYRHIRMRAGVHARPPPQPQLIDLRSLPLEDGLSAPLLDATARHLSDGGQVLLFINRRGYAPALLCHDCGSSAPCPHCDARLTLQDRKSVV
jgi:primosomal protein N' (replication factor Y)